MSQVSCDFQQQHDEHAVVTAAAADDAVIRKHLRLDDVPQIWVCLEPLKEIQISIIIKKVFCFAFTHFS